MKTHSNPQMTFADHILTVEAEGCRDNIRLWPRPEAWRFDTLQNRAFRIHPKLRPCGEAQVRAVNALFAEAHPDWPEIQDCFLEDPWSGIEFLYQGKAAALDLCRSNPAMVAALFNGLDTEAPGAAPGVAPWRLQQVLCRLNGPQTGFLELLGLPPEPRWIRLFQKMNLQLVYEAPVTQWLPDCASEPFWPLISHAKRIGVQLLPFCFRPDWLERITPRCFLEVLDSSWTPEEICRCFEEYFTGKEKGGLRVPRPRTFAQLQTQLQDIRQNRRHQTALAYHTVTLPPPPLAPLKNLRPLSSAIEIVRESGEMHNCVYDLLEEIRKGRYYLYALTGPERCTVGILWSPHDGWRLDQVMKACNRAPAPETLDRIVDWSSQAAVLREGGPGKPPRKPGKLNKPRRGRKAALDRADANPVDIQHERHLKTSVGRPGAVVSQPGTPQF